MQYSKYEQETIINYNQEEKTASCYTFDQALIRKLDKLCETSDDIFRVDGCTPGPAKEYVFPKKWVRIRPPRQMSDEQRAAASERAKKNFKHE